MDEKRLRELLNSVKSGNVTVDEAARVLKTLPYEDLGYSKIDHHRELRLGFPEVVFGRGKDVEKITRIIRAMREKESNVLVTRLSHYKAVLLRKEFPEGVYNEVARAFYILPKDHRRIGNVLVVSAGTSDIPVAEEAAVTAEVMGSFTQRIYDIGVAGIHRVFSNSESFKKASVIVVVAGMEGALPSVVGGLFSKPIIAVPTSIGYGANFKGLSALLGMLNSCAPGVSVVNIDNGFGAGYIANLINRIAEERETVHITDS
ncbi:MAG: 1-(5-phosphoribosyl)-5-amino-4-imidazole-carboxylate carboxylase [Candidatus Dadabacteria bacterium]